MKAGVRLGLRLLLNLYNQIPDMKQHDISSFVDFEDEADYYSMVVNEREEYLSRHGIAL